jgi:Myb/SANT-like DNA-binding domain
MTSKSTSSSPTDSQVSTLIPSKGPPPNAQPKASGKSSKTRLDWSDEMERSLAECYYESTSNGLKTDSGFKPQAHADAVTQMFTEFGVVCSKDQCKSKLAGMKKKYVVWAKLRDQSGFGVDVETGAVTAPDEVWNEYLAVRHLQQCLHVAANVIFWNTLTFCSVFNSPILKPPNSATPLLKTPPFLILSSATPSLQVHLLATTTASLKPMNHLLILLCRILTARKLKPHLTRNY